jgi:sulfur-oxidizing protein SoxA
MTRPGFGLALASVFATSFALAQGAPAADPRHSGYRDMGAELRRMQDDDSANPAMLFVQSGEALWRQKVGAAGKACADCHHDAAQSMKGVAARYPALVPGAASPVIGPVDLEGRINLCRTAQQKAPALAPESQDLLALTAWVALQSRGQPIAPPADPRLATFRSVGEDIFRSRQGQLNLSCANCHDDNAGKNLAGSPVPQGHPTGYPIYRLEWQTLGSLKRRLRNCLVGMRAEAWDWGDPQYIALTLYLMERARGMAMDAPAVRP